MTRSVTVELPEGVVQTLESIARQRQTSVEAVVKETVCSSLSALTWDYGEFTDEERRAMAQTALDRQDLWGSEADKVWDTWTPSNRATS